MLRADLLAFSTADAVTGLAVVYGMYIIIVVIGIPVMEYGLRIQAGEQIRDGNVLRAAINTVTACRTRDHMLGVEDVRYRFYRVHLRLI